MTTASFAPALLAAMLSVHQAPPAADWGPEATSSTASPRLMVPATSARGVRGTAVAQRLAGLPRSMRQDALTAEVLGGNVPAFVRDLTTIRYRALDANGLEHDVEISVTPDYVSVGDDSDFLRVSLDRTHAERIAAAAGAVLPTRFLVDRIHDAATVTVEPQPIPPCAAMVTMPWLLKHRDMLANQSLTTPSGLLRAGHKKDVVMTPRLAVQPNRVAIYGWHHRDGRPIQPLSLFHGHTYADYSHGVRLIDRRARIDGAEVDLAALLTDPIWAPLVSDEGALPASLIPGHAGKAS
jgi:hypothetical protein